MRTVTGLTDAGMKAFAAMNRERAAFGASARGAQEWYEGMVRQASCYYEDGQYSTAKAIKDKFTKFFTFSD